MSRIVEVQCQFARLWQGMTAARRGGVTLIFALLAPLLVLCMIGAIDLSQELTTRNHLQDATDAAALAVSATDSETPTSSEASLKTVATNILAANFKPGSNTNGTPVITTFAVCTPAQLTDCGASGVTNTVTITTQVKAPCWMPLTLPGVCTNDGQSHMLTATNTTNIGYPTTVQINLLLDVSGSMIVGSTPADVNAMITWNNNPANWKAVNDANASTPCAFACHFNGQGNGTTPTTSSGSANSDMQQGLTNAHAAGSTTRYDVLVKSASSLITYIQNKVANSPTLARNSYYFNIYAFSDGITKVYSSTTANDWAGTANAIQNNIYVGLDTHLSSVLSTFATMVGSNGTGYSLASPQKVVLLVTDGVQSDFYYDFPNNSNSSCGVSPDPSWKVADYNYPSSSYGSWAGYTETSCYVSPPPTTSCTTIKNNQIPMLVLETPYVPLTGQDPKEYYLYETFARHAIFPNGPTRPVANPANPSTPAVSAVSTALSNCASSPQMYGQADTNDPSSIQNGMQKLIDTYLASNDFLKQ